MKNWNNKVPFPSDSNYMNRIIDAKFAPSKSSGQPMLTLEYEVVAPTAGVVIGDSEYNLLGVKVKKYHVTKKLNEGIVDIDKTAESQEQIKELYVLHGLDSTDINWDNIDVKPFIGVVVYTQMYGEAVEERKLPTAEQLKRGDQGDLQRHPVTGEKLIQYRPQIKTVFGRVPDDVVAAMNLPRF